MTNHLKMVKLKSYTTTFTPSIFLAEHNKPISRQNFRSAR